MLLRDGSPGATGANGVANFPVLLDDAFLGHHQGFSGSHQIGVVPQITLGGGQRHETAPQGRGDTVPQKHLGTGRGRTGNIPFRRRPHAIADPHVTAMMNQQLAIPLRLGFKAVPGLVWLIQRHDQVTVTILHPFLNPDDKRHLHALIRGHLGNRLLSRRVGRIIGQHAVWQAGVLRVEAGNHGL